MKKTSAAKRGRPAKTEQTARKAFQVRLTDRERALIEGAAARNGVEPSTFMRAVVCASLGEPSPFSSMIPAVFEEK